MPVSNKLYNSFYVPRNKFELIDLIVKSGKWNGTKQSLKDKDIKVVRAIFCRIRQEAYQNAFKKEGMNASEGTKSQTIG